MLTSSLECQPSELEAATGWAIKPEGACRAEVCVPLPDDAWTADGKVRLDVLADRLAAPLVHDEQRGRWALGPSTLGGRALPSAEAPELELPDADGNPFKLSSLRGQKVLLVAWASW